MAENIRIKNSENDSDRDAPNMAEKRAESDEMNKQKNSGGTEKSITHRQETTRSLAFELLNMDVGYSSDEGGDEDNAFYVSSSMFLTLV